MSIITAFSESDRLIAECRKSVSADGRRRRIDGESATRSLGKHRRGNYPSFGLFRRGVLTVRIGTRRPAFARDGVVMGCATAAATFDAGWVEWAGFVAPVRRSSSGATALPVAASACLRSDAEAPFAFAARLAVTRPSTDVPSAQ